jgi:hypothetical protein
LYYNSLKDWNALKDWRYERNHRNGWIIPLARAAGDNQTHGGIVSSLSQPNGPGIQQVLMIMEL